MKYISISHLSLEIKDAINSYIPNGIWIKGEINQFSVNQYSGHCYINLIEKDPFNNKVIASIRATIWSSAYHRIATEFLSATNTTLRNNIEIVAYATVDYSPQYGISANITKIDPSYNLGQLAQQRIQHIATLKEEGIFDINRLLHLTSIPQRIAIISSATAAGYEDFIHQLNNNNRGHKFHTALFHSLMQGDNAAPSIIAALEQIYNNINSFDCVAIIRGGGATTDLLAFDDIDLCRLCAQFPIPILTGIGHTRDMSILDMVAHLSLKTPTALASFLVERIELTYTTLDAISNRLNNATQLTIQRANNNISSIAKRLPQMAQLQISYAQNKLNIINHSIQNNATKHIEKSVFHLEKYLTNIHHTTSQHILNNYNIINITEHKILASDPQTILKRGFTFTEVDGQTITSAKNISPNSTITTHFHDGTITSTTK